MKLPNLGIYYEPMNVAPDVVTRREIGLRDDACVFWCGQSLFKYLPQHDQVFPRIASEVPGCQFVFVDTGSIGAVANRKFRERVRGAFADYALNCEEHCVHLRRLPFSRFSAVLGLSDVFLNSISWSGFNTVMESLEHDLPIVSVSTGLMRGRHALAILQQMALDELVASSLDEYVRLAARLAQDPTWRSEIRAKIAERKNRAYRDNSVITELETFLENAARKGNPGL